MINKIVIMQDWDSHTSYPARFVYKVSIYRENKFAATGLACESKKETVAYIDGLQQAFRIHGETCEIEFVDWEGDEGDYCDYFLSNNEHLIG